MQIDVASGLYFPILLFVSTSQVTGCEDLLSNGLDCVGWGIKLCSSSISNREWVDVKVEGLLSHLLLCQPSSFIPVGPQGSRPSRRSYVEDHWKHTTQAATTRIHSWCAEGGYTPLHPLLPSWPLATLHLPSPAVSDKLHSMA